MGGRMTRGSVVRNYKAQLREYRALQAELAPWTAAFQGQYGRKPRLGDVELTGAPPQPQLCPCHSILPLTAERQSSGAARTCSLLPTGACIGHSGRRTRLFQAHRCLEGGGGGGEVGDRIFVTLISSEIPPLLLLTFLFLCQLGSKGIDLQAEPLDCCLAFASWLQKYGGHVIFPAVSHIACPPPPPPPPNFHLFTLLGSSRKTHRFVMFQMCDKKEEEFHPLT